MKHPNELTITKGFFAFILFVGLGAILFEAFQTSSNVFQYLFGYVIYGFGATVLLLILIFDYLKTGSFNKLFTWVLLGSIITLGLLYLKDVELFKSKIILRANTVGGSFGNSYLRLRENGTYEIESTHLLGSDTYKGKYKLRDNKIILLNKHSEVNYIPDTLVFFCDKIPLFYKADSLPDFSDSYFKINENELDNLGNNCH